MDWCFTFIIGISYFHYFFSYLEHVCIILILYMHFIVILRLRYITLFNRLLDCRLEDKKENLTFQV